MSTTPDTVYLTVFDSGCESFAGEIFTTEEAAQKWIASKEPNPTEAAMWSVEERTVHISLVPESRDEQIIRDVMATTTVTKDEELERLLRYALKLAKGE